VEPARRERARWAESLYSRFFEKDELKKVRDLLDCEANDPKVADLVTAEGSQWTDYLNFFEFVAYLQRSKQLKRRDVDSLFDYYFKCLARHKSVADYIQKPENGFESLSELVQSKKSLPRDR
jgi:hypothetical protein